TPEKSDACKAYEDFFIKKFKDTYETPEDLEKFYQEVSRVDTGTLQSEKISLSGDYCSFPDMKEIYHDQMNEFFNDKFERLGDIVKPDTADSFLENTSFYAPEIGCLKEENKTECDASLGWKKRAEIEEKCADNLSTYCVSMLALYRYTDYAEIIRRIQSVKLPTPSMTTTGAAYWTGYSELISNIAAQRSDIEQEIGNGSNYLYGDAYKVMKGTVIAYDEFRTAYPMHIKYDKIIKDLIKYKEKLKSIRNKVMIFPSKFTDITSITCP
ncbi:MAG: hypothetical protein WC269_01020, partial [Candidatus Gracilibacteria bacterium]